MKRDDDPPPPTRRTFFALLGAAATVLTIGDKLPPDDERPRSTWSGKTRWIGHC